MPEVQEVQPASHEGPGTPANASPPRLLEDPDGVVRFYFCGEVLGVVRGRGSLHFCETAGVKWVYRYLDGLDWTRPHAFRALQGASIQQLMGPRYVVLGADPRPPYYPVPGLDNVRLAEPTVPLEGEKLAEFIAQAYGYTPPAI